MRWVRRCTTDSDERTDRGVSEKMLEEVRSCFCIYCTSLSKEGSHEVQSFCFGSALATSLCERAIKDYKTNGIPLSVTIKARCDVNSCFFIRGGGVGERVLHAKFERERRLVRMLFVDRSKTGCSVGAVRKRAA